MLPNKSEELLEAERMSGASHVGLWKILAVSLGLVILGIALVAGVTAQ